ncbi:hypothetical protein [Duganella caerulea]
MKKIKGLHQSDAGLFFFRASKKVRAMFIGLTLSCGLFTIANTGE